MCMWFSNRLGTLFTVYVDCNIFLETSCVGNLLVFTCTAMYMHFWGFSILSSSNDLYYLLLVWTLAVYSHM